MSKKQILSSVKANFNILLAVAHLILHELDVFGVQLSVRQGFNLLQALRSLTQVPRRWMSQPPVVWKASTKLMAPAQPKRDLALGSGCRWLGNLEGMRHTSSPHSTEQSWN